MFVHPLDECLMVEDDYMTICDEYEPTSPIFVQDSDEDQVVFTESDMETEQIQSENDQIAESIQLERELREIRESQMYKIANDYVFNLQEGDQECSISLDAFSSTNFSDNAQYLQQFEQLSELPCLSFVQEISTASEQRANALSSQELQNSMPSMLETQLRDNPDGIMVWEDETIKPLNISNDNDIKLVSQFEERAENQQPIGLFNQLFDFLEMLS